MAEIVVKDFLEAGIHFGHRTSRWNPRMRPYIYGKRNLIHIIDIKETIRGLLRAKRYLQKVVSQGSLVLLVGTKKQAAEAVREIAEQTGMPYVDYRWLGGTFTNFRTIRNRMKRLEEIDQIFESGEIENYSKKRQSALTRERTKMHRNLNGLRSLNRLPECVVIIDPRKEKNCVHEARLTGVKVLALLDTDCNPDMVDLPIPGNDDSIRSIQLVLHHLAAAIMEGKGMLPTKDVAEPSMEEQYKAIPSIQS
ncbi:MAG: 30S ribosomal protein S2 [Planctomycetaceae bacterium]|nr:30S ribosomal protein S2 [Planctomycetaceae bacterium]